jgi:uncharacterized repeat protein (TIGR01451 family)
MKRSSALRRAGCILWSVVLIAGCLPALAQFRPVHRSDFPDFDSRTPAAKPERATERQRGQSHLVRQLPSAVVDFDSLLDSPTFVRSQQGFLTGPNGQDRAVSAAAAKAYAADDAFAPVKAFLAEHSALFGHGAAELDSARVKRDYVDAHNGLHTIVWEQQLDGIPVFQSVLSAHITKRGELTSLSSRFLPDLATSANAGTPARANLQGNPPVSASGAIRLAGDSIAAGVTATKITDTGKTAGDYLLFQTPEQASTRLVWFPLHRSALRLAWEVFVTRPATHESFQVIIDARSGQALYRKNMTFHISDATYNVYDSYSPTPFGPSLQTPGTFQPPETNRNSIVTPALDVTASPDGWIPDGSNTTTGNNVDAFLDRNFDGTPDVPRPQGNPSRVFNFPCDLTQDPTNYIDASTVELFWRANWYHDRLYQLGFTEAAGNFQDNTFGRGGIGNDHVIAYVQAGADVGFTDNSMFSTPPDGQCGQCYMFIFTGTNPYRDGSLDQEVVCHEMTHGTSWRLVGGGMVLGSLQGDGMGEGWSDFYSECLLNPTGADPDAAYASGGYVTYLFAGTGFNQNYYFGIRRYPYCTDMLKNPLTFKDIDPAQALPHKNVPLSPLFSPFDPSGADEVHNQGEVWCVTLWEMHSNLIHKYGWAVGNELTLQLTTDGMKLTPGFPNFLQARDAILLADQIDNGGANQTEIWQAFAKRGMGYSATSPDGSTTAGVHEAYDVPNVSTAGITVDHAEVFGGNGNGLIEFNECNSLNVILTNRGNADVTGISVTLASITPGVAVAQAISPYQNVFPFGSGTNLVPFKISTAPTFICGTPIDLSVRISSDQGLSFYLLTLPTGTPGTPLRFDNNVPVPVPSPGSASSLVVVSNVDFAVNKVTVSMFVEESIDLFLKLELISPDGTTNLLSANNGLGGQNYGLTCGSQAQRTTFDDAANISIADGTVPYIGTFKPAEPLAIFAGKSGTNVNGVWQLRATDSGRFDLVNIQCWSLFITPTLCSDGGGQCPGADVALGMTASPNPVVAGNNLTYTISVTNLGPSVVTNAVVSHLLPPNVTVVNVTASQGTYSQQGSLVAFTLGTMPVNIPATLTVTVQPNVAGKVYSTATVSAEQPDPNPGNNTVILPVQVNPPTSELAVGMIAVPNPALVGQTLTYTVAVTNNGPSVATPVNVTNILPAGVQIRSVTTSRGTTTTVGNIVLWNMNNLPKAAFGTATIVVTPTTEGLITASATVKAPQVDPVIANNTASVTTTVGPAADLAIGINDSPDPVVAGSNVVYEITVTNIGPSTATSVQVNDTLPPGVNLVSTNATQGTLSISNLNLIWSVGTMSAGATAKLTVEVATTANGTLPTTVSVFAPQSDPNPTNNIASITTTVAGPFVSILAASARITAESGPTNGAIDIGETVTLSLGLRNAGNVSTRNLVATLLATNGVVPVPPNTPQSYGIIFRSGPPVNRPFSFTATGTNGGAITAVLLLQDGTNTYPPVTFTFTLPNTRVFANPALISIPDPAAPNPPWQQQSGPGKPYPSVITVPNLAGVLGKVTVTLSNLNHTYPHDVNVLVVASNGVKTLLMSHAGNQASSGITLTFDDFAAAALPASGQLASGTYRPAAYTPPTTFPTNAPAGPYNADLKTFNSINPAGPWSLYVYDDGGGDDGQILGGWSIALTMITPVNQAADVAVQGGVVPNPVYAGRPLTYTFSVTNNGPDGASSVGFTNILPAGVTALSVTSSQGSLVTNATGVAGDLGPLGLGTNVAITVVAMPTAAAIPSGATNGTLTCTASIVGGETDLNLINNVASVLSTIYRPVAELVLAQAVSPDPVTVGYSITNLVTITNRGPDAALGAVVTQPLPPGVSFLAGSSSTTVGTLTNIAGTVTCYLGDLASNATATVMIVLANSAPGLMTNAVSVTSGSYDPATTNNASTYVATVISPTPQIVSAGVVMTYESGPVNGSIDVGETNTLSLSLANIGTLDTVNLKATLLATNGVTLPSGPQSYGTLIAGGPSLARSFTFKAAPAPGAAVIVTLKLQDERLGQTNNLGLVTYAFGAGAVTNVFTSAAIVIPDHGVSTPYPSAIAVAGVTGRVSKVTLTLNGLTHAFPHDINVLLVSPSGSNVLVMSHTGGGHGVTNATLTFDDAAATSLPNYEGFNSGTYKPSSYEGPVSLPNTALPTAYATTLAGAKWSSPNGDWRLYVFDDATGDAGTIVSGWSLKLTTLVTVGPVVDLAMGMTVPATVAVGGMLTNTMTVTNLGPDSATGVLLTNVLPGGASYVSTALSQGSVLSTAGGKVICDLGTVPPGASATVVVVTAPYQPGALVNSARAAASEEDLSAGNNTAQKTTTVSGPTVLSGSVSNGFFKLTVVAEPNYVYVVQGTTNVASSAAWVNLSTNTNTTGSFTYTDTSSPSIARRFYRTQRR